MIINLKIKLDSVKGVLVPRHNNNQYNSKGNICDWFIFLSWRINVRLVILCKTIKNIFNIKFNNVNKHKINTIRCALINHIPSIFFLVLNYQNAINLLCNDALVIPFVKSEFFLSLIILTHKFKDTKLINHLHAPNQQQRH